MSLLAVEGLTKRYGAVAALDSVTLSAEPGSRLAIVGPSGSGKTTFLRLVAGFETPDAGRVALGDETVSDASRFTPPHRRRVGYVPQDGALFPHLSVGANVGFGLDAPPADRARRIAELLELVELDASYAGRAPHQLSGGQQQRVALARALARKPALMLLDEPFSALDAGLRDSVRQTVARALEAAGVTACLVTHDQAEALVFADRLAVLRDGRLAQIGPPHEVYWRPVDAQTARFLGDAVILDADIGEGFVDCALGRIAATTQGRRGRGLAMLRPEQIRLLPRADAAAGVAARVVARVFAGADCRVELALPESGAPVAARALSLDAPEEGEEVRVAVSGKAHTLAS